MTSSDGFCSTLTFAPGELGQIFAGDVPTAKQPMITNTAHSSSQNTPMATPTSIAPPSPFPTGGHHHRTSSNLSVAPSPPPAPVAAGSNMRPSSPTRSNSTSSIATQSSFAQPAGSIISNPTLVGGSMPGIGAGNSNFMTGMPMTTPPQTPRSTTSSVSGIKRDHSESEREEGGEKKKRRITPTLMGTDVAALASTSRSASSSAPKTDGAVP
jgi:chromatin assembly factor 1 subunit B